MPVEVIKYALAHGQNVDTVGVSLTQVAPLLHDYACDWTREVIARCLCPLRSSPLFVHSRQLFTLELLEKYKQLNSAAGLIRLITYFFARGSSVGVKQ